ncbi:MAG TPA: ABC-type transport auxiliary lipoprotein family protein, partial [Burkholderiaceae bacterium]|nr:ABC-type transport auxiliary lipoprotein family protein [Burkholderiaceae bacterium]
SVRVAAAFARTALVYRVQESQYTADAYNAFIAEPAAMLGNEIAGWLNDAGQFKSVSQPGATQPSPLVLEVTVTELYGDFRPQQTPAAVLSAQFNLIDTTQPRAKVVLERTLSSRIPLQQASPDALVQGYGRALGDVLTQFIAALNART